MRSLLRLLPAIVALAGAPAAHGATGVVGGTGGASGGTSGTGGTAPTTPQAADDQPVANGPGVYRVWACRTPTGEPAPADGWRYASQTTEAAVVSSCASGGFLGLAVGTGAYAAAGTLVWFPAPGLEGLSADLWRTAAASSTQDITSTPPGLARIIVSRAGADEITASNLPGVPDGTKVLARKTKDVESLLSTALPGKTRGTTFNLRAAENTVTLDPLLRGHQQQVPPIQIESECAYWYANYACTANYTVWAADLRLRDAAAPTATNLSGPLVDAVSGGAQSGIVGFTARAQDVGAGVLRSVIEVDGAINVETPSSQISSTCTPRAGADGLRAYLVQQPCPLDVIVTSDLDTRTIADGEHTVRMLVEDAAGNQTVVAKGPLLVRNAQSIGAGSPAALRGQPNGSVATDVAQLTLSWPATARAASTKPSVQRQCKRASYAKRFPTACRGREAATAVERAWSGSGTERLRIALATADGAPIAGARVHVNWRASATSPASGALPAVVTGSDGTAEVTVAKADGSRVFAASWAARTSDTRPAATAQATLTVRAATSLTAPRRVAPAAQVTFRGELRGQAGARNDVPITLEVRNQGEWKTFATASSDSTGRWRTSLRFAPRPGRYPVRVRIGKSGEYPYAPGLDAETAVIVRR